MALRHPRYPRRCSYFCSYSVSCSLVFGCWFTYEPINEWRMGGDSNPRCLSAHTLSRRAQSTALSPIHSNLPRHRNLSPAGDNRNRGRVGERVRLLKLQPPKQFVEGQLDADVKFAEVRVLGADWIEPHFVNDRFDLECVARKKCHAPFGVIETGGTGDELFHFASELAADIGVTFHQFAAFVIRKRIPVALFAAAFAHIVETNHWPIRQRWVNALLAVMPHSLAKRG